MEFLFLKKEKWENFFLRIVLIFGCIFMLITPIMQVQDEDTHTMRSINMSYFNYDYKNGFNIFSSVYTFIETYTEGRSIYVYESDPTFRTDFDLYWECTRIPLNEANQVFFKDGPEGGLRTMLYGNLSYLPQGLGILVGRFFDLPIFYVLILGRFFKLLFYSILCYWAIKLIPVKKELLTMLCLMPMPIVFAASLSPDGVLVASSYLFFAYILYCKDKGKITIRDGILLLVLLMFIFSVKMIYSIIVLMLLLMFNEKNFLEKHKKRLMYVIPILIGVVIIGIIILYNVNSTMHMFLNNLPMAIYLYFKTYITNFTDLLSGGIANFGTGLNRFPKRLVYLIALYVVIVAIQRDNSLNRDKIITILDIKTRIVLLLIFILISIPIFGVFFCEVMLLCGGELSKDTFIPNIQGRYFIAFMPLLLTAITSRKIDFKWLTHEYVIKTVSVALLVVSSIWILYRYW